MNNNGGDEPREEIQPLAGEAPVPADALDPVIEVYKRDVDRTLLRQNLKLTVEERLKKLEDAAGFMAELRAAGAARRASRKSDRE